MTEGIAWAPDYETAIARARTQHKLVMAFFWLEGRPLCRQMEVETLAAANVIVALGARFISVKVPIDKRSDLFERIVGGRGGLATCIVDSSEDVVSMLLGFGAPEVFVSFLDNADKGYRRLVAARAAVKQKPKDPARLLALSEIYEALGSPRRAEEGYAALVALGGDGIPSGVALIRAVAISHERLARFSIMRGRNQEARAHIDAYRKLDAANRFDRFDRIALTEGLVLSVERRMSEAIRILREAIALYPRSPELDHMIFALGSTQHEMRNDAPALATLQMLVEKYPHSRWVAPAQERIGHIKNPPADHQH